MLPFFDELLFRKSFKDTREIYSDKPWRILRRFIALFCWHFHTSLFYVLSKERLTFEIIVWNYCINQKTHNNMSINVFPLSHQAGTIWRHAYSNYICFSAKGASLRYYSPSFFCRTIQIGRLLWYILRWWWQSLCQKPSIGRHARSVSCVPFCCWFLWFYYILIRFNLFELTKLRLECHNQEFSQHL